MLSLGFSPCPNDTFIFEAIVNQRIDLEGLDFRFVIADVEELNRKALQAELDVSKISFGIYHELQKNYTLLNSGAALGENCGPLLVSKLNYCLDDLPSLKIAIPGIHTTANLLLKILFPKAVNKVEMIFSSIEEAVLEGKADVGLIIHESRFTYAQRGLRLLADLGKYWESRTGTPTPLGGIVARSSIVPETIQTIDRVIHRSLEFAFANPDAGWDFIKQHAQETDDEVIRRHIDLYVNHYSLDLGERGRAAVRCLLEKTVV